jgi:hypothetical protein
MASILLAFLIAATPFSPDVYPINQRGLRIPIRVDPSRRAEIKELILFTSNDLGRSWSEYSVASPDQDAFAFYAPNDGIYWFSVCVVDQRGNREPADIYKVQPSQKILVDTVKPLINLYAERQGEDVAVRWEIQEDHPDLSSLRLEYQPSDAPGNAWYPVTVTGSITGQARVRAPGPINLRMQMQDASANIGGATAQAGGMTGGFASSPAAAYTPSAGPPQTPASDATRVVMPAPAGPAPPGGDPGAASYPTSNYQTLNLAAEAANRAVASSDGGSPYYGATIGNRPNRTTAPPKLLNTTQLTINYEVTKWGPSGIGKVDLWITRDDGRTWQYFADDPDLKPPMTVELPGEGVYGFCLVIQSRAGLGRRPPSPGDPPDIRVEVDTTPPSAQLIAPQPDPRQRNALILSWTATDRNLAPNPITLQWAEKPDGAWQTIAQDLPNLGRYTWKLPSGIPAQVYLRLIARDLAGNEGIAETKEPQLIDLNEPEGRILDVVGNRQP